MTELNDVQSETADALYTVTEAAKVLDAATIKATLLVEPDMPVHFSTPQQWATSIQNLEDDEDTEAVLHVAGTDYIMTKRALELLGLKYHVTRKYMSIVPASLLEPHMDYWLSDRVDDFRLMLNGDRVVGLSKSPKVPLFSSSTILEVASSQLAEALKMAPEDLYVDYKLDHSLDSTSFRVVSPTILKTIAVQRDGQTVEDVWSPGITVNHSQSGMYSTTFEAYLFNWGETNGVLATHAAAGKFDRRSHGDEFSELDDWAGVIANDIVADLPLQLEDVENLVSVDLKGEMADAANAVFRRFKVPTAAQGAILDELVSVDDWSAYGLLNAISSAANPSDTDEAIRNKLFRAAGDMAAAYAERCDTCHRIGD